MSYEYASTLYPTAQARMLALVEDWLTATGSEPFEYAVNLCREQSHADLIKEMIATEWIEAHEVDEATEALKTIAASEVFS